VSGAKVRVADADLCADLHLELGESARWFGGRLHWVDIPTGRRFSWVPGAAAPEAIVEADTLSAVFDAGRRGIGLVAGDRIELTGPGGRKPLLELPSEWLAGGRTNDARVDAQGRLWVGTVASDPDSRRARLLRVEGGHCTTALRDLTLANGVDVAGDGRIYLVDTFAHTVLRCTLDGAGEIVDAAPFIVVEHALPDGLCVDADGGIWIALWGGSGVERYDAEGRRTDLIRTPGASQTTSLAFGGSDLRDVFITTAAEGSKDAHGGALFVARARIPGRIEPALPGAQRKDDV
jgi:D-xylonolactonase